jgi:hypothetical protein
MSDDSVAPPPDPDIELVTVFESGDQGLIALVKSLLEADDIDYLVRAEGLQDLFGAGRLAIGFSAVAGPAEFLVRKEDEARARELLRDLPS